MVSSSSLELRVTVDTDASCLFSYSVDGRAGGHPVGPSFAASPGLWIGARVGLFAVSRSGAPVAGRADFDWFRIE